MSQADKQMSELLAEVLQHMKDEVRRDTDAMIADRCASYPGPRLELPLVSVMFRALASAINEDMMKEKLTFFIDPRLIEGEVPQGNVFFLTPPGVLLSVVFTEIVGENQIHLVPDSRMDDFLDMTMGSGPVGRDA